MHWAIASRPATVCDNLVPGMDVKQLKAVLPRSVRRPLCRSRRWLRALPSRTRRQKERLLASGGLTPDERELLARAESRISYEDASNSALKRLASCRLT